MEINLTLAVDDDDAYSIHSLQLFIFFILFQLWQMQCTPFILSTYLTHRSNSSLISAGDQSMANLFWINGVMYSWLAFPACMKRTGDCIVCLSSQYASQDILWDKRTSIFYSKSEMEVTFSVSAITKYNNLIQRFHLSFSWRGPKTTWAAFSGAKDLSFSKTKQSWSWKNYCSIEGEDQLFRRGFSRTCLLASAQKTFLYMKKILAVILG